MSTTVATRDSTKSLPAGSWRVDPVHSHVGFAVQYVVGTFRGSFSPIGVKLNVAEDGTATLAGSVPVQGVKVQDENLAAHLQSPEFFDAERAPEIAFRSTRIQRSGDKVEIDGELTIKGITLDVESAGSVTEPTGDAHGGVRFALELETTIDRTKFGLDWNNPLPSGEQALANEVTLTAALFLVKE